MLQILFTMGLALSLSVSSLAHAEDASEFIDPQSLIFSVVKITNESADIFTADTQSSHGTGFFIGLDSETKRGLIFTNKHVIETDAHHAQRLMLEFNTNQRRGERIMARLVYSSLLHDFAVLDFDLKALKRANLSSPLRLPKKKSPFFDFQGNERNLRGLEVMAIGNPFEGSNVTTYGQITGLHFDPSMGPFIQTQTPINPGNSGGPLISLQTGEVIGINTMTMSGADGTHWAIPIGILMQEFGEWRKQKKSKLAPTIADPRQVRFSMSLMHEGTLQQMQLYSAIEKAVPGYFENYNSVLMVTDSADGRLRYGDILLRMNGQVIGGFPYDFTRRLQRVQGSVKMQILRAGKVMNLEVHFPSEGYHSRRQEVDYVYLSGLLLQEMGMDMPRRIRPGLTSRVAVTQLVDSPEVNFDSSRFPPPGSVIAAVSFGGDQLPVRTLFDLKQALKANANKPFVVLHVYKANYLSRSSGEVIPLLSPATGAPLVDGVLDIYILPLKDVLTPSRFSLHKFKKQFDFYAEGDATRDWRRFVRGKSVDSGSKQKTDQGCESVLIVPGKK